MTGVAVILAARNEEALIGEALASIAAQTHPPQEVLLVDDGSMDRTIAAAREAMPDLRVIARQAAGPAAALNCGLAATRQPLVAFLDADDLWCPGKLALQRAVLEREPALDGVLGLVEAFVCPRAAAAARTAFRAPEGLQPGWSFSALLARRELFARVGPLAEDIFHGYAIDWFDRARRQHAARFAVPAERVLRRRLRPGSFSQRPVMLQHGYLEVARRALQRRRAPGPPAEA